MSRRIYKVFRAAEWDAFVRTGRFQGSPADLRDGFIHLSSEEQVAGTLAKHFAGENSVIVGEIDMGLVQSGLRWEASRGGELFPHLYAPLELSALARAVRYCRAGGKLEPLEEVALP